MSLVTTASAAAGGQWRARPPLCWSAPTAYWCAWGGETLPQLNQTPVEVPVLEQAGQAREDWAVLAMTGE